MAKSSLDIAVRADDQASPKVAAITRSITADLEAAQKRGFDLTHSAREREERDVQQHYAKLRSLYQQRIQQNLKGEQHAQGRQSQALETLDLKSGDEYERAGRDLATIRALRMKSQEALKALDVAEAAERAAIQKAAGDRRTSDLNTLNKRLFDATHSAKEREIAAVKANSAKLTAQYTNDAEMRKKIVMAEESEIAEIRKRYGNNIVGRIGQRYQLAAGYAASALAAAGVTTAVFDMLTARAKASGAQTAEEGVEGIIGKKASYSALVHRIPIVGALFGDAIDKFTNKAGAEEFLQRTQRTKEQIDALGKSIQNLASSASQARATALGFTAYDQLGMASDARDSAGRSAINAAQRAAIEARSNLEEARGKGITGAPLDDFRERAERAATYLSELQRVLSVERAYNEVIRKRQEYLERSAFGAAMSSREARLRGEGQGLAGRQTAEQVEFAGRFNKEMDQYDSVHDRMAELRNRKKWVTDWTETEAAQRTKDEEAALGSPVSAARASQIRREAARNATAAYDEERTRVDDLERRRVRNLVVLNDEEKAMKRRQELERQSQQSELALRSKRAQFGGDTVSERNRLAEEELNARHEAELRGLSPESQEYKDRALVQEQERRAQQIQMERDWAKQRQSWETDALRIEAATSRSRIATRDAELEALRREQSEEERIYGRSAEMTRKYSAKKSEINDAYQRSRADEELNLQQVILRSAGRGAEAEILAIRDKYQKLRETAGGDKDLLGQIGAAERAELFGAQRQLAMRNQVPAEIQAYTSRFLQSGQGRNYLQDQFRESQEQTKWLQEIAKVIAANKGLVITNVSMQ